MAQHVFILGAGASASAGAPLMRTFMDAAEDLLRSGEKRIRRSDFERVFAAIHELGRAHSKATLDTNNVESVFAAFEIASLIGRLGHLMDDAVSELPVALARVIVDTLEHTMRFTYVHSDLRSSSAYRQFAFLLRMLFEAGDSCAVITFNYDIALELALVEQGLAPNYLLPPERERMSRYPGGVDVLPVELLKLHGSINWVRKQTEAAKIRVAPISDLIGGATDFREEHNDVRLVVSEYLKKAGYEGDPVIVPPTMSKLGHYRALSPIWRRAAEHFGEAQNIVVCGFALADADAFFRLLYALGTISPERLRRFWVVDTDTHGVVDGRFRALLGPVALERYEFIEEGFEALGRLVAEQLGVAIPPYGVGASS